MKKFLPYDLPVPLQKAFFQRILLGFGFLLMVVLVWVSAHEWGAFIGLLGTVYFLCSAFILTSSWNSGKIIAVKGQCASSDSSIGSMVQVVFSVTGIEESALTLNIPKRSIKTVPGLFYTLYISAANHSILYGIEAAASDTISS